MREARVQQPIGTHLAQLNVGRALDDMDSVRLREFVDNLDRVNAIAERSAGFAWRLTGEGSNNATDIKIGGDPRFILNMSVWETPEQFEHSFGIRCISGFTVGRRAGSSP
jgi:hypothetical protein